MHYLARTTVTKQGHTPVSCMCEARGGDAWAARATWHRTPQAAPCGGPAYCGCVTASQHCMDTSALTRTSAAHPARLIDVVSPSAGTVATRHGWRPGARVRAAQGGGVLPRFRARKLRRMRCGERVLGATYMRHRRRRWIRRVERRGVVDRRIRNRGLSRSERIVPPLGLGAEHGKYERPCTA